MAKKKWYAVTAGRAVGLFDNWLLVAPLVIGVSESHYVSFTSEEDAWKAYEEARDEGNIRILPSGAKSESSRSPCKGRSPSRNDEHCPSTEPGPSRGCAMSSSKTVPSTTTITSPETVTLVGGNSPARPVSRERASSSKSAAAPHLPPARSSSSKGAPPSPAPPARFTKAEEFVRLYVASSKTKKRPVSSSTSRKSSPYPGSPTTHVPSRARRVVIREPSFLRPYPDELEGSDDEQPVLNAELLSPLTFPRLHTPEPYEEPLSPSSQAPETPRYRQPDDVHSLASIMSAMGLASSQVTGGPSYDAVADPRSPLAKTAPIPRNSRSVSCILDKMNIR
ncbi:hypothetical protein DFS33DRAFT_1283451 [Desarmillaria ectypa]|nr:hypothetical protein DFS33DRAFT_1283451 [Desarmillaria ectypa]